MTGKASMPLSLDPETVTLLRETLDDAWSCLRPEQQATMQKTALAVRILRGSQRNFCLWLWLESASGELPGEFFCWPVVSYQSKIV